LLLVEIAFEQLRFNSRILHQRQNIFDVDVSIHRKREVVKLILTLTAIVMNYDIDCKSLINICKYMNITQEPSHYIDRVLARFAYMIELLFSYFLYMFFIFSLYFL